MKHRWDVATGLDAVCAVFQQELGLSRLAAQCLANRGIRDLGEASRFLDPRLRVMADPFLLPGMRTGVDCLFTARASGTKVVIFGDYDVDGVSATAILVEFLGKHGWKVDWYLPHRMDEGYGLTQSAIESCIAKFRPGLLLAVDCGSTSVSQIDWLNHQGITSVVLDHHQVCVPAPVAAAIINPQLGEHFRELCSAGLAFKLAHACVKEGRARGLAEFAESDIRPFLDLVALGTIADLVPLTGENRILTVAGLRALNESTRPGLLALREVAKTPKVLGAGAVGYQLGPRLNAAGRLESAEMSLELLLARDRHSAMPRASALDACNRDRQQIERSTASAAIKRIRAKFDPGRDFAIVEGDSAWHIGVVGIVASRVLREFYRPTIILGGDADGWRGSGRSIAGFDLAAGLRQCSDLLTKHGGHAMAAGISLPESRVTAFRGRLNQVAAAALQAEDLIPKLRLDAICSLDEIDARLIQELERIEPFGQGNPPIQLCIENVRHTRAPQRLKDEHWKMWLTNGARSIVALWWGAGDRQCPTGDFDLAAVPEWSEYDGQRQLQLRVLECRDR